MLFRIFQMEAAPRDKFIIIIAYVAALLIGLILHELAHGYVAKWNGDDTAHMAGRLSFNPLKHLDPIGTLCMLLIGFGWAKPVPINTRNFRNFRRGFFTVAIAGITVNLIIALIFTGAFHAVMTFGAGGISQNTPEIILVLLQLALYFSFYSVYINLTLMVFNISFGRLPCCRGLGRGQEPGYRQVCRFCQAERVLACSRRHFDIKFYRRAA